MSFSLLLLLVFIGLLGIYSFTLLALNKNIVHLDLFFIEIDFQLGNIVLISACFGIVIASILEIIYFFSRRKNKSE
tara:strand:- start:209 stop:436 length:228 start_codon:yes stop_codon:yes gene_type:complete